jgi:hypothetical protein
VGQVFEQCLFALPTAEEHGPTAPPKCKTVESRTAAFALLTELVRDRLHTLRLNAPLASSRAPPASSFMRQHSQAKDNEECFRELVALLNTQLNKRTVPADYPHRPALRGHSLALCCFTVEVNGWWMQGGRLPRSKYGYVGLQNQGATCYMNSLMQQLFLIPRFRQGILLGMRLPPPSRSLQGCAIDCVLTFCDCLLLLDWSS